MSVTELYELENEKLLNFKDLFVEQYKLENQKGNVLFYEDARTTLDFEFNFGALYTVMYIFVVCYQVLHPPYLTSQHHH